jgi:polyisoprenoid-binding protein YceI
LLALIPAPAAVAQTTVQFDPAHSTVNYDLAATMHAVHGTFKLKSGAIQVDPVTGRATGAVVVDATSGESGSASRDKNMHNNVLESGKYSEIVFSPTQLTADPGHTVKEALESQGTTVIHANGLFSLHGQQHDITLDFTVVNSGGGHVDLTGKFTVPYVKWGLKSPNTFLLHVGDTVDLEIHAGAQVQSR